MKTKITRHFVYVDVNNKTLINGNNITSLVFWRYWKPQALEVRTPLFTPLVPPAIMVWIFVWKYIFEPFIHMLQHFMLQLSRSNNFSF
jgi:hypothetical protein